MRVTCPRCKTSVEVTRQSDLRHVINYTDEAMIPCLYIKDELTRRERVPALRCPDLEKAVTARTQPRFRP